MSNGWLSFQEAVIATGIAIGKVLIIRLVENQIYRILLFAGGSTSLNMFEITIVKFNM